MSEEPTKERLRQIYEMREAGKTFIEIGADLKMSGAQAANIHEIAVCKQAKGWLYGDWCQILLAKIDDVAEENR